MLECCEKPAQQIQSGIVPYRHSVLPSFPFKLFHLHAFRLTQPGF